MSFLHQTRRGLSGGNSIPMALSMIDWYSCPCLCLPKVGKWKDYISVIRIGNAKGLELSKVGGV